MVVTLHKTGKQSENGQEEGIGQDWNLTYVSAIWFVVFVMTCPKGNLLHDRLIKS